MKATFEEAVRAAAEILKEDRILKHSYDDLEHFQKLACHKIVRQAARLVKKIREMRKEKEQ